MSNRAVVTMCRGEEFEKLAELTHPTIKAYADKIDADFVVIRDKKISTKFFHYEKFQIYDLFKDYSRIIYLDTDLIIRPDCPNLFDIVPEYFLGAFNEGEFNDLLPVVRDACMKYKVNIPKWDRQSYNTGVMVLSRLHRPLFKKPEQEFDIYAGRYSHFEQPYITLQIVTSGCYVKNLDYKFNRMSLMDQLTGDHRLSSYIVHYASAADLNVRMDLIKADLASWQETAPNYYYQKNIHVNIGGGLGDQIDAEPVVRYICEKAYKGDNIRVMTHFPDVFKHLPVNIADEKELRESTIAYFVMNTLPSTESAIWQIVAQSLCHTTDFASMSALRRIIPDKDKQIVLKVDPQALLSATGCVQIDLKELVLVHPGKGWASKTFPTHYWQSVIDSLHDAGLKVAVIGKYLSNDQGLVDIVCKDGVIDLRNMLSLQELFAVISQAKILITNDSAPVHIAGAFDNWIILIPSCKHPDHVLPYRHGSKSYKSFSLYKKLTTDAIDSLPTQVNGQTIDYVIGNIMDYLPEISEVVDIVKKCYHDRGASIETDKLMQELNRL